jgi:acetyl esterase/lipase
MLYTAFAIGAPVAAAAGVAAAAVTRYHLTGENLSKYDSADLAVTFRTDPKSEGAKAVKDYLIENFIKPAAAPGSPKDKLAAKRKRFDDVGRSREYDCEFREAVIKAKGRDITGEWTLPKNADPTRRILYIHGGANTVGSAISHRPIITNIANRTGCAVFAPNYRLMPEHARLDGVEDCRTAYEWIVKNGPDGAGKATSLAVGGDSAGGNLALSLINWIRDSKKRPPDAVFVMSPATDTTCTSPSLKNNFKTDLMLQPLAEPLTRLPHAALLWALWRANRVSPSNPVISPVFADLKDLPPTLVHVSSAEMLYDDSRRYAAKRAACGSPVTIQIWDHVPHVWHVFDRMLPEAHDAFDEIASFLRKQGATAS